jgi:hypothetical protein
MNLLPLSVRQSPVLIRVVPFALFLVLTFSQGYVGDTGRFWIYAAKTVLGAWLLWEMRALVAEMRWHFSLEALGVGVAVFALWVGLVPLLSGLGLNPSFAELKLTAQPWNPFDAFGPASALGWFFVIVRIFGSACVVPPLEEVFYRSFLYRYLANKDFQSVPFSHFAWMPFLVTSLVFGLEHREWLAGLLCGFAFQGLVCWKRRLGDAIAAHAITNLLLGVWVVWRGAWHFW